MIHPVSETLQISLDSQLPMQLRYELDKSTSSHIQFFLAPTVDDNDITE